MLFSKEFDASLYNKVLKYGFNESILYSPVFMLPLDHYLIHFTLLSISHIFPPNRWRIILFFPLLCLHLFKSPLNQFQEGSDSLTKVFHGVIMAQFFMMTFNLSTTFSELTDYRLRFKNSDGIDDHHDIARFQPYTYAKLKWAFQRCFINMRGIGWNFQFSNITKVPSKEMNKWEFIFFKCFLYETMMKMVFFDFAFFTFNVLKTNNVNQQSYHMVKLYYDLLTYSPFMRSVFQSLSGLYCFYFGLNVSYWQLAILSLTVGVSSVEEWPDMFMMGNGIGMRKFWSTWWHQYITRDSYIASKRIVDSFSVSKPIRRLLLITITFAIVGVIHAYGSLSLDWSAYDSNPEIPGFVPKSMTLPFDLAEVHVGRFYYSVFLFLFSAVVLIVECLVEESGVLDFSILKNPYVKYVCVVGVYCYMATIESWPFLMYFKELEYGGLSLTQYYKYSLSNYIT